MAMEVKCTQCGAPTPVMEQQGLAFCKACNASLYVDIKEGVPHHVATPIIKPQSLRALLTSWLAAKERKGGIEVRDAPVVYWPFWEVTSDNGKPIEIIAAAHPITAMEGAGQSAAEMNIFEAEEQYTGVYFQPPDDTIADLLERHKMAGSKVRLFHLPFYQTGYDYNQKRYEAWVNAVNGKVYADDLPPTFAKKKDELYRNAVMIMAVVYILLAIMVPSGNIAFCVMAAASVPLYFVVRNYLSKEYS